MIAPPPKPDSYKNLKPGEWHVPRDHVELSFMREEQTHPPHMRKRSDDLERLKLLPEVEIKFNKPTPRRNHKRNEFDEITYKDLKWKDTGIESMTAPEFDNYLASLKAKPFSDDFQAHPIILFDTIRPLLQNPEPDLSMIPKFKIKLTFKDEAAVSYAREKWKLNPKDPKDYFYLVCDAAVPEDPALIRATPFQVQQVFASGKVVTMLAYPMSWDVLSKLDIDIYKSTTQAQPAKQVRPQSPSPGLSPPKPKPYKDGLFPTKKQKNLGLTKRAFGDIDLNPGFSVPINLSRPKDETLFHYPLGDVMPEAPVDVKVDVKCKECYARGKFELAARFRSTWWYVEEASLHAAADVKAVLDIQTKIELEKKWKKKFRLGYFPITPFTIFGVLNFGPEIEISVENWLAIKGELEMGTRVEATLNTAFNLDLMNIPAFDPSTIKGPEIKFKPYVTKANLKFTAGVALVSGIAISADILGSGIGSKMELMAPKFEYEIATGYDKSGFCGDNKGAIKEDKRDLQSQNIRYIQKREDAKEEKTSGEIGISAIPKLGLQLRFTALEGSGLLKELIPPMGEWEPEFLGHMWPLPSKICGVIHDFGNRTYPTPGQLGKVDMNRKLTEREKKLYQVQTANRKIEEKIAAIKFEKLPPNFGKVVPLLSFRVQPVPVTRFEFDDAAGKITNKTVMEKQRIWVLRHPNGAPLIDGKREMSGTMKEFPMLQGCYLNILDERSNTRKNFMACMSEDPFIRSKTWCPMTPDLKTLKGMFLKKDFKHKMWCQSPEVYDSPSAPVRDKDDAYESRCPGRPLRRAISAPSGDLKDCWDSGKI
ncbi:hypothetical protein TWF694_009382 [Orbilia ellipsospora]|uniref:DUF7223 domain-containing protein n=1 Tax=Orbilia ellipsospora TaxID=2528407 RepID=A0AAV9XBZ4_9PEZI